MPANVALSSGILRTNAKPIHFYFDGEFVHEAQILNPLLVVPKNSPCNKKSTPTCSQILRPKNLVVK